MSERRVSERRVWSDLSADEQERVTRLLRPDPDDNLDDLLARCKRAQEIIRGEPSRERLVSAVDVQQLPEWLPVKTSDYRLRALRDRHYAGGVGGLTVGQPGRRIAFVTFEGTAGWVSHWPDPQYVHHAFGDAFVCTHFRKECPGLASAMIEDAIRRTELRWGPPPEGRWLTFVDPAEVESPNPGYCFKQAGFYPVGRTKDRGLLVLERVGRSVVGLHCDCRADDWTEGDEGAIRCVQCGGYAGEPGTSIRVVEVA